MLGTYLTIIGPVARRLRLVFDGGAARSAVSSARRSSSTRVRPLVGHASAHAGTAGTVHAQVALEHEALSLRTHANVTHQDGDLRGRHAHGAKGACHDAALAADAVVLVDADAMVLWIKEQGARGAGLGARSVLAVVTCHRRGNLVGARYAPSEVRRCCREYRAPRCTPPYRFGTQCSVKNQPRLVYCPCCSLPPESHAGETLSTLPRTARGPASTNRMHAAKHALGRVSPTIYRLNIRSCRGQT